MPSDSVPTDPRISDTAQTNGRTGETLGVWAYAGTVVVECEEGGVLTDAHLTVEKAREFARHIFVMADLAETWERTDGR